VGLGVEHWRSEGEWEESVVRSALVPRIGDIEGVLKT
jgi:hypothetical protein